MKFNNEQISLIISGLALMQNKYKESALGYYNGSFNTKIPADEVYERCISIKEKIIYFKE